MGPSARSGYLCTAPDWKTERRRSEVCKEGAVQRYPDLARGDLKNSISFLVEVDSVKLATPTILMACIIYKICFVIFDLCFQSTRPYLAPQTGAKITKKIIVTDSRAL